MKSEIAKLIVGPGQKGRKSLADIGIMTFIVRKENIVICVENGNLDGCGADIDTESYILVSDFHANTSFLTKTHKETVSQWFREPIDMNRHSKVLYDNGVEKATNKRYENSIKKKLVGLLM